MIRGLLLPPPGHMGLACSLEPLVRMGVRLQLQHRAVHVPRRFWWVVSWRLVGTGGLPGLPTRLSPRMARGISCGGTRRLPSRVSQRESQRTRQQHLQPATKPHAQRRERTKPRTHAAESCGHASQQRLLRPQRERLPPKPGKLATTQPGQLAEQPQWKRSEPGPQCTDSKPRRVSDTELPAQRWSGTCRRAKEMRSGAVRVVTTAARSYRTINARGIVGLPG